MNDIPAEAEHIKDWFNELYQGKPITWQDMKAYMDVTGELIKPDEARVLAMMSRCFLNTYRTLERSNGR